MRATAASATPARRDSLLWPTLGTVAGAAVLIALGCWQLRRLAWKTALIATMAARTSAPPVPLPQPADWAALQPAAYAYRHVTLTGTFDHTAEAHVFRPLAAPHGPIGGLGDLVLTPLHLAGGGTVIVNRGFVPEDRLDPGTRASGQVAGQVTIAGLMREPEERNSFTPADQPATHLWFTRDPASIAAALRLGDIAPFTIDQDASAVPGGLPQGGETVLSVPNDHMSYALTWFGLAAALIAVYAVRVSRRLSEPQQRAPA